MDVVPYYQPTYSIGLFLLGFSCVDDADVGSFLLFGFFRMRDEEDGVGSSRHCSYPLSKASNYGVVPYCL